MNWFTRLLSGRTSRIQQHHTPPTVFWDVLTVAEQTIYRERLVEVLRASDVSDSQVFGHIYPRQAHSAAMDELGKRVSRIPLDVIIECFEIVEPRPYTMELTTDGAIELRFIQNLKRVTALMAPAPLLARAAVRDALDRGEVCAITLEKLSEYTEHCVGICGHVFSVAAAEQTRCPKCREPVAWTRILVAQDGYGDLGHSS